MPPTTDSANPSTVRYSDGHKCVSRSSRRHNMATKTSDGGGKMMLRMSSSRTATSHSNSPATPIPIGQPSSTKNLPTLLSMARLDQFAQAPNVLIEALILHH